MAKSPGTDAIRANEATFRARAAAHERASDAAERDLKLAEECREIAERRERHGWPR